MLELLFYVWAIPALGVFLYSEFHEWYMYLVKGRTDNKMPITEWPPSCTILNNGSYLAHDVVPTNKRENI